MILNQDSSRGAARHNHAMAGVLHRSIFISLANEWDDEFLNCIEELVGVSYRAIS